MTRPARPWLTPLLLVSLVVLVAATTARADPRWWWNDVRVTNNPGDSYVPHVAPIRYQPGGLANAVFVAWQDESDGGGDTEIWFTATFDGGCSFCPPMRITDNDAPDRRPRIAVMVLPEGLFSIAVAFENDEQVAIAWDSTHADARVPAGQLCAELAKIATAIIAGDQYVRFGSLPRLTDHPDIVAVTIPSDGHFHAVYRQDTAVGSRVFAIRDLSARGGPGWTASPPKMLSGPGRGASIDNVDPAIAGDSLTSPDPVTGMPTAGRTAVDVVFVEHGLGVERSLAYARSVDSGTTFSPTGMTTDAPGGSLSDPLLGRSPSNPEIDATYRGFSSTMPAWIATAWDDYNSSSTWASEIWTDGRHFDLPANPSPDWCPDVSLGGSTGFDDESVTAIAIEYPFPGLGARAWVGWTDSATGQREIHARGGLLDPTAPTFLDHSRFPIPAMRSLDPVVSRAFQLTACAFDEATFDCLPSRTWGDANVASFGANETGTYAVWSDTRDGNYEIYFKRTDGWISLGAPRLATGCSPDGSAWIDATFDQPPSCATRGAIEKMLRYRVYWSTQAGGPYDMVRGPVEIAHDDAAGTVTRRITGLVPATTYHVIVVPEDEARNVLPAAFDPAIRQPGVLANEESIATPDPCVAPRICLWRSDIGSLLPHVPARLAVYLVPPSGDDISLQGPAYQCPIATGDLEQDAGALGNGVALSCYQVNLAVGMLRLAKAGTTIRFAF